MPPKNPITPENNPNLLQPKRDSQNGSEMPSQAPPENTENQIFKNTLAKAILKLAQKMINEQIQILTEMDDNDDVDQ